MHPVNTLDLARERQAELRRQARAASRRPTASAPQVGAVRHGVAHTLRRVADQLEPASLTRSEDGLRLIR